VEPDVVGLVLVATGHDGPDLPSEQARVGGVPTVADSVPTAAMYLEPKADLRFHPQSCGYRPGRSALDAVAAYGEPAENRLNG
jgi:hypothetical protein